MTSAPHDTQTAVSHALSAGKYAAYVWPSYAVTALGFVWMIVDTLTRAARWRAKADRLERSKD